MELQRKVAEAIHVLNHDPESSNRVAANQWLVQFQLTPAAWDVSTSLLTSPIVSLFDLQFFAAQILRRKVLTFSSDSQFRLLKDTLFSNPLFVLGFQIQNEASNLQSTAKDALLNALLLAAKRYSSGVPQVLYPFFVCVSPAIGTKRLCVYVFCGILGNCSY